MILKFNKCLNEKNEYTLVSFSMTDELDGVTKDTLKENKIYETPEHYYYFIKDIIDIGKCEKFKVKVKKGDIVSITARDNSYIVYPSKVSFSYAFNLDYTKVREYTYKEVLLDGKPYVVTYVKEKEDKVNDGVVYTLAQLTSYVVTLIKAYNYRETKKMLKDEKDPVTRLINKYYTSERIETSPKYELNVKKVWLDENNHWQQPETLINVSKSNRYEYDHYLLRMFAYMILTKSKADRERKQDAIYCFNETFDTLEDVYQFLEEHQDIVNTFFIETELLFNKPNSMISMYAPHIEGIYMFYSYNNVKTYLYRSKDREAFESKTLKSTYVSTRYRHKIKGIKQNYDGSKNI